MPIVQFSLHIVDVSTDPFFRSGERIISDRRRRSRTISKFLEFVLSAFGGGAFEESEFGDDDAESRHCGVGGKEDWCFGRDGNVIEGVVFPPSFVEEDGIAGYDGGSHV